MTIRWRYWNRIFHRDLGYLFFGMTVIYALSGIALNHIKDWNPNYIIERKEIRLENPPDAASIRKADVLAILKQQHIRDDYKKHYFPQPDVLKIFIRGGSVEIDLHTGAGVVEKLSKRPLFYHVNFLHYNPRRLWLWFSDSFCIALIIVAITGLFIIKGKKGITGRGAWLTGIGIVIPLILLIMYM